MSDFEEGIDPELRAEFIDESIDGLGRVAALLVDLEANPDNADTVQSIFRPVHSIKGNSAYFGLLQTKTLAHEMELALDLIRKKALHPDANVVGALLQGVDDLNAMLARVRAGEAETPDSAAFERLLGEIRGLVSGGKRPDEECWRKLLERLKTLDAPDALAQAESLARNYPGGRRARGSTAGGGASTARGPAPAKPRAALGAAPTAVPKPKETRPLLEAAVAASTAPNGDALGAKALADFDVLARTVGLGDPVSRSLLRKHLEQLFPVRPAAKAEPSAKAPAVAAAPSALQENKTMRVPEERIDAFLAHVGELVTIGEMYSHMQARLFSGADCQKASLELRRINEYFDQLSLSLQHSIMQIRKLPMATLLGRMPRLVRDVAEARGKAIETVVTGDETMVDKSHLDALDAPLVHMVRNAADHGVETPEERRAAGKPEKGRIVVSAEETADEVVVTVSDDGKGIDRRALAAKAVKLGLIAPDAVLSDADAVQVLFMSGVSTAKEVTDVSGRGVGMDVVKRSVEAMGGRIDVASEPGKGTEMRVRLPKTVTTQILDGFIVVSDGGRYIFPLKSVQRCFRPTRTDFAPVSGRGLCVKDGGRLLRVMRLGERLGMVEGQRSALGLDDGILVVVEGAAQTVAVFVDAIEGVRRVVVKDIVGLAKMEKHLFAGGAIMGDGSVALVLDVEHALAEA